tara:strand:+ start:847 stop:981 length:135 start_codon:yes stop_codon:yes gene_type:complete
MKGLRSKESSDFKNNQNFFLKNVQISNENHKEHKKPKSSKVKAD